MEHFIAAFTNYANFQGRASRTQYWMFGLIYFVIFIAITAIEAVLQIPGIIGLVFSIAMIVPMFAYGARRLHDMGRSGWWQLLIIIPVIGSIIVLVMLCLPTKPESIEKYEPQKS